MQNIRVEIAAFKSDAVCLTLLCSLVLRSGSVGTWGLWKLLLKCPVLRFLS